jgi:RNA polymerase sigma factor (sigma-70 family)
MASQLEVAEIQEIAGKYFPLAITIATSRWRSLPEGVIQCDDLIGAASVRLVDCLHKYDSSRGTPLSVWITFNIHNGITDALRALDLLPQAQRTQIRLVREAEEHLEARLQRSPSYAEIATFLQSTGSQYSETDIERVKQMGQIGMVPLETDERHGGVEQQVRGRQRSVTVGSSPQEHQVALQQWFTALSIQEKVAVRMLAVGARLEGIGQVLGVSRATAGRLINAVADKATAYFP